MQNTHSNSDIPRDSVVVEYVAGVLSGHAKGQFERKLKIDLALQKAVELERALRAEFRPLLERDAYTASDNFDALWQRIENDESPPALSNKSANRQPANGRDDAVGLSAMTEGETRRFGVYSVAASLAVVGVMAALFVQPFKDRFLAADYQGLSNSQAGQIDLPSMVSEARIAKLTLAQPMPTKAIGELLAGYQLDLISQMPEQDGLIVVAQRSINTDMINGWRNDSRIADAEVVSLNVKEK